MVILIKQKPLPGARRRRKFQKKVIKKLKKVFPLATSPLNSRGKRLTNI